MAQNGASSARRLVQIRKILRFAVQRGFAKFDELDLDSGRLTTAGIVLTTKGAKNVNRTFATLTDGRDQIQLVLTSGPVGTSSALPLTIQRGDRVSVTGVPFLAGRSKEKAIPSLFVVEFHSDSSPAPIAFDETALYREVTPRLEIGQLMSLFSKQFEGYGYVRYEPRFITSSHVALDTEPLMVRFPGRGADLFLEVSPLPQLLYAAVMTGEAKLYSPTRLFSRAYRDGFTSADSPIIAAVEIETRGGPKLDFEKLTSSLASSLNNAQQRDLPFYPVSNSDIMIENGTGSLEQASSVTVRVIDLPSALESQYAYDVRRCVEIKTPSGQVIIDGHEGKIARAISYNWLCIHVERLALGDFWRIHQRRGPES